jgi:hypothetical protein
MFSSNTTQTSGGYEIQRSLRFNSADSARLNRSLTTPTDNKKFTFSLWLKRSTFSLFQDIVSVNASTAFIFTSANILYFGNGGGVAATSAVFRDPSAWYHIVYLYDSANATANDRMIIYVNNVRQTLGTNTPPSLNATGSMNSAAPHYIGSYLASAEFFNGYMTEVNFIDGQALTPSSFGEINADTGVWQPKRYAGSYGTNGFYLNFSDNSNTTAATLGADYSGNGNNWTPNNFSVSAGAGNDSLVDVPTNWGVDTGVGGTVRGNYCTLNPLDNGGLTLSNGNLQFDKAATGWKSTRSTFGMATGKWYWESTITAATGEHYCQQGVALSSADITSYFSTTTAGFAYESDALKINGSFTSYGASYGVNDVIGVAFDADAGTLTFYKNGTSQGVAYSGMAANTYFPAVGLWGTVTANINFGQRPFAYTAPSGFKALNTQNLPTPTIGATPATQAGKFFNPVLYMGNGTGQSITGVGFQPDWVWIKGRSGTTDHALYDAVRGVQNQIESNNTGAETAELTGLTAFGSDGFTTGLLAQLNTITATYVAWNWKANGAGVTNTAGTITSTVSANTTSGFSVVTYTGTGANATVGHGLGVAPKMVIVKRRNSTGGWPVRHASITAANSLYLNETSASTSYPTIWNSTAPTSTVFSIGANVDSNASGGTYVAYCFADIEGFSKAGSYTGNGSADGPFVFTGFRPAFVVLKNAANGAASWRMWDSARNTYNVVNSSLFPNLSNAEVSTADYAIDFLSNGFKIRSADDGQNQNNDLVIFVAFAENPFKYSLAR